METTEAERQRAEELAEKARSLTLQRDFAGAHRALAEASSLAPESGKVRAAWAAARDEEKKSPLAEACRRWVEVRRAENEKRKQDGGQKSRESDADGETALQYVTDDARQLTGDEATTAMTCLLDFEDEDDAADRVTAELFKYPVARKAVAERLQESPSPAFKRLFVRGDRTADGVVRTLLDETAWPSAAVRIVAMRDIFMLALAKLMEAGLDYPERTMRMISTLLAHDVANLNGIIDGDSFDVILNALDIRSPVSLRAQATLATAKLLELSPDSAQRLITQFITERVKRPTAEGLIVSFSAAAAIFPITPSVAATAFLSEGFLQNFVGLVETRKSHRLEHAALELLSTACVDKTCREAVSKHLRHWLQGIVDSNLDKKTSGLAALVLVKITEETARLPKSPDIPTLETTAGIAGGGTAQDELVARFKEEALSADPGMQQDAIEGLAYASLQPRVKEQLARDTVLLKRLVAVMNAESASKPIMFGGLAIFVNLTRYLPAQSEEEKRLAQLRAYASAAAAGSGGNPANNPAARQHLSPREFKPDPLDDDAHVTVRCKRVLSSNVIPTLLACSRRASPSVLAQMLHILLSLSKAPQHRGPLAQRGAVKLLLGVWDALEKEAHPAPSSYNSASHRTAAHALARILISVNPAHVFSTAAAVPATAAVRPLLYLLTEQPEPGATDISSDTPRDLLPTFEALLALTNLASLDESTRSLIVRLAFPALDADLLLSANALVQRAAVELVCNLAASPEGAAKFTEMSAQAAQRLHVLLALADAEDEAARKAAGGALAMLTEEGKVAEKIVGMERGVGMVLGMLEDESVEVRHRGAVCTMNLVGHQGKVGAEVRAAVGSADGANRLRAARDEAENGGEGAAVVAAVAAEALRLLEEGG